MDGATGNNFGLPVAISGDYVVVGATDGNTLSRAGCAYIFKRNGTTWTQEAKIVASDRAIDDAFGNSISINGDYVVVGASYDSEDIISGNTKRWAGSAYIFKRNGTSWTQEAKIVASDRAEYDSFGNSVAINGDYVVVGAYFESEDVTGGNTLINAGSAYFFKRSLVIPIELSDFKGRNTEGGNLLTWTTVSEFNTKHFRKVNLITSTIFKRKS